MCICYQKRKAMFEISEDICNKIIEECEKYKFCDINNLGNYEAFCKNIYYDDPNDYRRLICIKKIILYLFGTLNDDTITLEEDIDAIIPEGIDDYSLGSFKKFNHPGKNNNKFCINCINCRNCTGCIDCTGCRKCKNCQSCKKCTNCIRCVDCDKCKSCCKCDSCKECELCEECEYCDNCESCNECMNVGDCFECEWLTMCSDCSHCYGCQHCYNCEYCNDCLGCDGYHFEEGADHDD